MSNFAVKSPHFVYVLNAILDEILVWDVKLRVEN